QSNRISWFSEAPVKHVPTLALREGRCKPKINTAAKKAHPENFTQDAYAMDQLLATSSILSMVT
ncbi:MAG: hypothetical protein NT115_09505, partial [Proteobacteria bacterium]|nr:hypothetical protein [Pseudomonadota bacterium]